MALSGSVLYEEQLEQLRHLLALLVNGANARAAFLIDRSGQQIAAVGDQIEEMDPTSLASLAAGNVASTDALAKLVGEKEFSALVHEGERENLHFSMINGRSILLMLFDERSSLGLVRLRVRKATTDLAEILTQVEANQGHESEEGRAMAAALAEITDDDIDSLFA